MAKKNLHAGHRERLRNRIVNSGAETLEDHELLEALLFSCFARCNTNEIAHELLYTFKSLEGVLSATEEELCRVPGIGPTSAGFIKDVALIHERLAELENMSCPLMCVYVDPSDVDDTTFCSITLFDERKCPVRNSYFSARTEIDENLRSILLMLLADEARTAVITEYRVPPERFPADVIMQVCQMKEILREMRMPYAEQYASPGGGNIISYVPPDIVPIQEAESDY